MPLVFLETTPTVPPVFPEIAPARLLVLLEIPRPSQALSPKSPSQPPIFLKIVPPLLSGIAPAASPVLLETHEVPAS